MSGDHLYAMSQSLSLDMSKMENNSSSAMTFDTDTRDPDSQVFAPSENVVDSFGKEASEQTAPEGSEDDNSNSSHTGCVATPIPAIPAEIEKRLPKLYKDTKLAPLDLKFDMVREEKFTVDLVTAHKTILKTQILHARRNAQASVLFVVKRPGCILCHEQGHDLRKLVAEFPATSVGAFACIKEIDVDNEGLLQLYQNHFQFPFYKDTDQRVYKTLGDRKVSILQALGRYAMAKTRWEGKGLKGNMIGKGEGMVLGGVMVFNRKAELQYVYQEQFGLELPIDEIRRAIKAVINE